MNKRIAFVGAGAIGGYVGASLAACGHDVTLIDPWPAHVEAIRAGGMHLHGMTETENRTVSVNAMHITDVQELARQRPVDIAFIAVKSYDTVWAARLMRQYLSPCGYLVSSQNCINEERIAGVVGWGRTVGCVVGGGVGVELFEPGHVRRSMMKNPNVVSRRRHGACHQQSLGRALDQALRQRHAQRGVGCDRAWRQCARQS
jgi:2-dehydropantoate 2-reductase